MNLLLLLWMIGTLEGIMERGLEGLNSLRGESGQPSLEGLIAGSPSSSFCPVMYPFNSIDDCAAAATAPAVDDGDTGEHHIARVIGAKCIAWEKRSTQFGRAERGQPAHINLLGTVPPQLTS